MASRPKPAAFCLVLDRCGSMAGEAMRAKAKVRIEPVLPVDILGVYLLLPVR